MSKELYKFTVFVLVVCFIMTVIVIVKEVGLDNPFSIVLLVGGVIFGLAALVLGFKRADEV